MNRRELLGATVAVAGATLAGRAARAAAPGDGIEHGGLAGRDYAPAVEAVRAYAEQHRAAHSIPGMTLAMVDRDGFLAVLNLGQADVDRQIAVTSAHLFQVGSITKQMAALCALRLRAAGRLDLNGEVAALLPGAGVPGGITLAHLLEHSSGLPDDAPLFPRANDDKLWQGYAPRTHWSYSNIGYALVGMVLERVSGQPFSALVRDLVFAPLGMADAHGAIRAEDRARYAAGYQPYVPDLGWGDGDRLGVAPWADVTFAAGCIAATAHDMARYLRWLVDASEGRGAPLLSDADARVFTTATMDAPGWPGGGRYGYGLATMQIDGRPMLHHTGGMVAFSSSMHVDPAAGVACFASTNIGNTEYRPRDVTLYACQLLRAVREGGVASTARSLAKPFAKAADYAGRYARADGRAIELVARGDGLRARLDGGEVPVEAVAPDLLFVRSPAWGRYLLKAERQGGAVAGLWYGSDWYARPGVAAKPAPAPELAALAGRYDADGLWGGSVRVVARADGLWADGVTPMTRLADGSWRVGADDWSPERAWFDGRIDGRLRRVSWSGNDWYRREDA